MCLLVPLMFLQKFELLLERGLSYHLRSDRPLVEPLRYLSQSTANRPDVFYCLKDLLIYPPLYRSKNIQNVAQLGKIRPIHVFYRLSELRQYLCHFRLLQIISTEEEVLPWSWLIHHRQRSFQLQIQIMYFVKLRDELFNKALVEYHVAVILLGAFFDCLRLQKEIFSFAYFVF